MAYSSAFGLAQRSSAYGLAHNITVALASAVKQNKSAPVLQLPFQFHVIYYFELVKKPMDFKKKRGSPEQTPFK